MINQDDTSGTIDWSVSKQQLASEQESGDQAVCKPFPNGFLVAVIDGLGHGTDAATAARKAAITLERHASEPVAELVQVCHQELIGTRGAVMNLASFDLQKHIMSWVGVGNVEGALLRADVNEIPSQYPLVPKNGVVGYNLPTLRTSTVPLKSGDTLIFLTDGIHFSFGERAPLVGSPRRIVDNIMKFSRGDDDSLVLAVRYLGDAQ